MQSENSTYLATTVGPPLTQCLQEVAFVRPADPIEWIAQWLYRYMDNEFYFYEKSHFLLNAIISQRDLEYSEHQRQQNVTFLKAAIEDTRNKLFNARISRKKSVRGDKNMAGRKAKKMIHGHSDRLKQYMGTIKGQGVRFQEEPRDKEEKIVPKKELSEKLVTSKPKKVSVHMTKSLETTGSLPLKKLKRLKPVFVKAPIERQAIERETIESPEIIIHKEELQRMSKDYSQRRRSEELNAKREELENEIKRAEIERNIERQKFEQEENELLERMKQLEESMHFMNDDELQNAREELEKEGRERQTRLLEFQSITTAKALELEEQSQAIAQEEALLASELAEQRDNIDSLEEMKIKTSRWKTLSQKLSLFVANKGKNVPRESQTNQTRKTSNVFNLLYSIAPTGEQNARDTPSVVLEPVVYEPEHDEHEHDEHEDDEHEDQQPENEDMPTTTTGSETSEPSPTVTNQIQSHPPRATWTLDCTRGLICTHSVLGTMSNRPPLLPIESPDWWERMGFQARTLYDHEIYSTDDICDEVHRGLLPHLTQAEFVQPGPWLQETMFKSVTTNLKEHYLMNPITDED